MKTIKAKVCIVGGGSAGFGCAYRLAKNGISVAVIEKNTNFGGTAVFGGVNCWEPGVSLDGVHSELVKELQQIKNGCFVAETVPNCRLIEGTGEHSFDKYPWGLSVGTDREYECTERRCLRLVEESGEIYRRFQYDDYAMIEAMNNVLKPYENSMQKLFGYTLAGYESKGNKVTAVIAERGSEKVTVETEYFVDATGSIVLARMAGCEYFVGSESAETYNEPSAPMKRNMNINGTTYVFRITKTDDPNYIDEIPPKYLNFDATEHLRTISCFNTYPNGDINVNMLPTMSGEKYIELGDRADFTGHAIVYHYWHYLQEYKGMRGYKLVKIFDAAIREDYRLVGKYVLTENDIRKGVIAQDLQDRIVAVADHALDMHGKGGGGGEVIIPYGLPIDCAITNEYENLLVACRGSSFSHIAASSARLTRSMISFGEGVGEYIKEMMLYGEFKNEIQGKNFNIFRGWIKEMCNGCKQKW